MTSSWSSHHVDGVNTVCFVCTRRISAGQGRRAFSPVIRAALRQYLHVVVLDDDDDDFKYRWPKFVCPSCRITLQRADKNKDLIESLRQRFVKFAHVDECRANDCQICVHHSTNQRAERKRLPAVFGEPATPPAINPPGLCPRCYRSMYDRVKHQCTASRSDIIEVLRKRLDDAQLAEPLAISVIRCNIGAATGFSQLRDIRGPAVPVALGAVAKPVESAESVGWSSLIPTSAKSSRKSSTQNAPDHVVDGL